MGLCLFKARKHICAFLLISSSLLTSEIIAILIGKLYLFYMYKKVRNLPGLKDVPYIVIKGAMICHFLIFIEAGLF